MRSWLSVLIIVLTSCAPQSDNSNQPVEQYPLAKSPPMPELARDAQKLVETYFQLIRQGRYGDAYKLWGNGGADTRGTAVAFEESFKRYSTYLPEVGGPTEIKISDGQQYIAISVKLRVKLRSDGRVVDQSGVVMLRRSANSKEEQLHKRNWRIWGTDIRARG